MRMVSKLGLGFAAAATLALAPAQTATSQQGRQACAPRDNLVQQLNFQYRERQQAIGLLGEKAIVEVFVSQAGTWTILVTDTNGTSCIMAAGESWDDSLNIAAQSEGA